MSGSITEEHMDDGLIRRSLMLPFPLLVCNPIQIGKGKSPAKAIPSAFPQCNRVSEKSCLKPFPNVFGSPNGNLKITPIEKENYLPNLRFWVPC